MYEQLLQSQYQFYMHAYDNFVQVVFVLQNTLRDVSYSKLHNICSKKIISVII